MKTNNGVIKAFVMSTSMLFCAAAHAATYSAVSDFSLAQNPNGPWSYLYGTALLPTPVVGVGAQMGIAYWHDGLPVPNSAIIGKNITGSTLTYLGSIVIPTNYLILDPESNSVSDVRFTVPSTDTYSITGAFLGIDSNERAHPIRILSNGFVVFSGTIGSYGQSDPFSLTESLNAGDVLDFESLTGATYTFLSTGLSATITPVTSPEPSTWSCAALTIAFSGIWLVVKKRNQTSSS